MKPYGMVSERCCLPLCPRPTACVLVDGHDQRFSFCADCAPKYERLGYRRETAEREHGGEA